MKDFDSAKELKLVMLKQLRHDTNQKYQASDSKKLKFLNSLSMILVSKTVPAYSLKRQNEALFTVLSLNRKGLVSHSNL